MAEYIDRDEVLDMSYCPTSLTWDNPLAEQKSVVDVDDINSIPAADVVEVKHAHWEVLSLPTTIDGILQIHTECSNCKIQRYIPAVKKHGYYYCPNCGAKMDGVNNG